MHAAENGSWVSYGAWMNIRHERNFWSWKHFRREEDIKLLREELPTENPNHPGAEDESSA